MSTTTTSATDPLQTLRELTAAQIRQRVQSLDAERKSLIVLLRSVAARERALTRRRLEVASHAS